MLKGELGSLLNDYNKMWEEINSVMHKLINA